MKKTRTLIAICLSLLFLLSVGSCALAYKDDKASLFLFFSWMQGDGSWHDWVNGTDKAAKNVTLKIGQPVKCKLVGMSKVQSCFSFRIREPGTIQGRTFDVLEGNDEDISYQYYIRCPGYDLSSVEERYWDQFKTTNESFEYVWVLKTNSRWAGGKAPLNCYYMIAYTIHDRVDREQTIAMPYISRENWTGPGYNPSGTGVGGINGEGNNTAITKNAPGFDLMCLLVGLTLIIVTIKLRRKR